MKKEQNTSKSITVGRVKEIEKIWLNNKEAQAYLGVSAYFLEDLRNHGGLHSYKVRNLLFYRKTDLDRLVESNRMT